MTQRVSGNQAADGFRRKVQSREQSFAAFDALPPRLRTAVRETVHNLSPLEVLQWHRRGIPEERILERIENYNREVLLIRYMRQVWPAGHPQERGTIASAEELGL